MSEAAHDRGVALQRCDQFVGRTMNWLYDHLRHVPRYRPVVLTDNLANREEFPELEARLNPRMRLSRRLWRKLAGQRPYPADRRWLREQSPVLLHSHFGYVARGDLPLQHLLEVPWLIGFYGADVYQLGRLEEWQDVYAEIFERVSLVLALGPVMADALKALGCPDEKVEVHPLGVDVVQIPFSPRESRAGEPLKLLFAGTFREKKGIEYAIDGVHQARSAGVDVVLHLVGDAMSKAGDDESKRSVLGRIESSGLDDVVIRHPFLTFEELLTLALDCHVFLAPSVVAANGDSEGTPFVLQQLMASGMTAISTVHSDIPYIFGDQAGLLVPERDAGAIAQRLIQYRDEPDLVHAHGVALGEEVRQSLDVSLRAGALADLYARVLN